MGKQTYHFSEHGVVYAWHAWRQLPLYDVLCRPNCSRNAVYNNSTVHVLSCRKKCAIPVFRSVSELNGTSDFAEQQMDSSAHNALQHY